MSETQPQAQETHGTPERPTDITPFDRLRRRFGDAARAQGFEVGDAHAMHDAVRNPSVWRTLWVRSAAIESGETPEQCQQTVCRELAQEAIRQGDQNPHVDSFRTFLQLPPEGHIDWYQTLINVTSGRPAARTAPRARDAGPTVTVSRENTYNGLTQEQWMAQETRRIAEEDDARRAKAEERRLQEAWRRSARQQAQTAGESNIGERDTATADTPPTSEVADAGEPIDATSQDVADAGEGSMDEADSSDTYDTDMARAFRAAREKVASNTATSTDTPKDSTFNGLTYEQWQQQEAARQAQADADAQAKLEAEIAERRAKTGSTSSRPEPAQQRVDASPPQNQRQQEDGKSALDRVREAAEAQERSAQENGGRLRRQQREEALTFWKEYTEQPNKRKFAVGLHRIASLVGGQNTFTKEQLGEELHVFFDMLNLYYRPTNQEWQNFLYPRIGGALVFVRMSDLAYAVTGRNIHPDDLEEYSRVQDYNREVDRHNAVVQDTRRGALQQHKTMPAFMRQDEVSKLKTLRLRVISATHSDQFTGDDKVMFEAFYKWINQSSTDLAAMNDIR